MADQSKTPIPTQKRTEKTPTTHQTVKYVTAAGIGATLLVLSGLTVTATVIALVVATPVLVVCSPVLVPAGIVMFLVVTGFLFSGGFGIAAVSALSWIYRYVTGKQPRGSEQVDYARTMLEKKAREVKERAKKYGQNKAQEVTQGS